jgi:hypothetical protein
MGQLKEEHKESFMAELVNMCSHENFPLLMGVIIIFWGTNLRRIMITTMNHGHSCLMLLLMA